MATKPQNILVVRNDKLGDFMLAYPAFIYLKQQLPTARITALVPEYTRPMAELCSGIDEILLDSGTGSYKWWPAGLRQQLASGRFDALITLFSTTRLGLAARLAGIPYRLAPATKFAQVFYNQRLSQRRSRSEKPEYQYNLDLVRRFCHDFAIEAGPQPEPPYLHFSPAEIEGMAEAFRRDHDIPQRHDLVFIHPGSGGSAANLSLEQYAELARSLKSRGEFYIVISAGPGEEDRARRLSILLPTIGHTVFQSKNGLVDFAKHLQMARLFISSSTGPLHIAGALDTPTAAFYTRRRSAIPLRWQTLNSKAKRLAFSPPGDAAEEDMSTIDIQEAALMISQTFLQKAAG